MEKGCKVTAFVSLAGCKIDKREGNQNEGSKTMKDELFQMHELKSILGDYAGDFDMDGIIRDATEVRADGNRYWTVFDEDFTAILHKHEKVADEDMVEALCDDYKAEVWYQHDPYADFGELFVRTGNASIRDWIERTFNTHEEDTMSGLYYVIPIGNGEDYQERLWPVVEHLSI